MVSTLQGDACLTLDLVGSPATQPPTHFAFDYLKCIFSLVTISFLKNKTKQFLSKTWTKTNQNLIVSTLISVQEFSQF